MINPFPSRIPDDKAEAIAARRTAIAKEQAGMFAEFIEPVTAEMVQAGVKAHHDRFDAMQVVLEERAVRFRAEVERLVTPEEMTVLLKRLAALPDCPAYRADFWRRELKYLGQELPAE